MNNPGIDYGNGKTNINRVTGIRNGVISQHSISPEACDDIFTGSHSTDMGYENWKDEMCDQLGSKIDEFIDEHIHIHKEGLRDLLVDAFRDWYWFGDQYQGDEIIPHYDDGDYIIEKCLDTDLFILKSPYYTWAQFCSPCVPGAGNLDHPCEDGAKAYCLGHDFFEEGKAPYKVFSVETDCEIVVKEEKVECPNCKGTGRDTVSRLAEVRGCSVDEVIESIQSGKTPVDDLRDIPGDATFKCFRCGGIGHTIENVQTEV